MSLPRRVGVGWEGIKKLAKRVHVKDYSMKIRPIGRDFEATCSGCGEIMLVMEGDSVNFRMGPPVDIGGVSIPMPQAVLCVACHRKENSSADLSIKFVSLYCTGCGRTLTPEDDFEP